MAIKNGPEGRGPTSALDAPGPLTGGPVRRPITGVMEIGLLKQNPYWPRESTRRGTNLERVPGPGSGM